MGAFKLHYPTAFNIGAILALWAIFWVVVSLLLSYFGGWYALARQFKTREAYKGAFWRWQSAHMRSVARYHDCISVGANAEGLYVAPFFPFRIAHPPLFVPWNEISCTRRKILFREMFCFELGRHQAVPFWVQEKLGEQIREAAGNAWPAEALEFSAAR